ncbi:MAG: type ISP restriction/modification enzyme [Vicinamibacterales bacterium]
MNDIKRHKRFTVVIGNPPYAGHSANASVDDDGEPTHIGRLLRSYFDVAGTPLGERNPKWLQDDYVKFVRQAQFWIDATGTGVLGFITNHGYLDNPTFRGMREKLSKTFARIAFLDLHGNLNKRERTPEGRPDENVFDIQQGVAIGIFARSSRDASRRVTHGDLWGERAAKYQALLKGCPGLHRADLPVDSPNYLFVAQDTALGDEYRRGIPIPAVMPVNTVGIVTGQDAETIGFGRHDAEELAKRHELPPTCVQPTLYRPMDRRFIVYSQKVVTRPREDVMRHMLAGPNVGLITTRSTKDMWDAYVTGSLSGHKTCSAYDINYMFPLYVYERSLGLSGKRIGGDNDLIQQPNFDRRFLKSLATTLQLNENGEHGVPTGLTPEAIFHYAYAVFHSPGYRSRYAEFLKSDFPRLPLTGSLKLFHALARLGGELTALHLLESPKLAEPITEFIGGRNPEVEKVSWVRNTVWIDKAQTTGFKGCPGEVWNFHIGGYQVCEKWLKDRKGRTLSKDDIAHYQKIVVSLAETIRLMKEIDEVIEQHGGWPGAFQASAYPKEETRPLLKVAEPKGEYGQKD